MTYPVAGLAYPRGHYGAFLVSECLYLGKNFVGLYTLMLAEGDPSYVAVGLGHEQAARDPLGFE